MTRRTNKGPGAIVAAVLVLGTLAALFLIQNFGESGLDRTWPALLIALGISLIPFGYLELGLATSGVFCVGLLANLKLIPAFGRSWPFALIWVIGVLIVGFFRSRQSVRAKSA
jgi:hypothetical protein